jgi:UDP-4-amino-4,6-dideoxy-N-acetyl-beta-L-altrosamine N-acetyltransferase
MKYEKYGITLSLMREEDIEMVRQWRNDPVVVANYEFREYINPEMQKEWFAKVNNINNLYTVIGYQGKKIGVVNLKNIDWENQTVEGGIFIPDTRYHETPVTSMVSFLTTEIMILLFNWKAAKAHVLKDNKPIQSFIRNLGYELSPGQENVNNQEYTLDREKFEKMAPKIRKAIHILAQDTLPGRFVVEPFDFDNPVALFFEDLAKRNLALSKTETTEEGRIYYFG